MPLLRSVFTISFFISISRILGFIRDILIAQYLGVSMLSDAFFAAFRLPNFFRRIFAEGAFNSAFVPIFIEKLQNKKSDQDELLFVRNIFSFLFYALLIFTILFQIFMPFFMEILFPGFFTDPEKSSTLVSLSRITIFYLIFISLVSLCSGILNSISKFAVPASAPIVLNLTLIASVFVFGAIVPNYAYALSWGVFVAGILQFLWVFIFTAKSGFLLYPQMPKFNSDAKKFFKKLIPGIIGGNVMQINLLVDSIFASMIAGAVSYLYYADRINQLPLAMIGIAIGIALLPALSRKIKSGENDGAIKLQNMALEVGLILVIPATLALTVLAYPIISSLFERGKFTSSESAFVAQALMFYSFGLPSYVLVKVMEPAFFSRGDTKTPMKIAFLCLAANAALNAIFFFLEMGYVGIVLASVISTYLNLTTLVTTLIRKKHFYFEKDFAKKMILILIPSFLMALALFIMREHFAQSESLGKIAELTVMILVGLLVYGVAAFFSGSLNILLKSSFLKRKKNDIIPSA
ncbi:MAG: murein biosynthesis integral membrane protein MurJ [Rickettsiales bacterium]|nr:murein biosynthesis integral membrane protein MurJ [Rickettsiales bacterium]